MQRLVHPLQQRECELELIAALEKDGRQVGDADELNGTYKGVVLLKTTYFLAQPDEATKQAVARLQRRLTPDEGEDLILMCYTSQDFREGLDAFLTKRAPQWRGQ